MSEVQGKAVDLKLLGRVMQFIRPYRVVFFLTLILTITLGFMAPIRPLLIQQAIDTQIVIDVDDLSKVLADCFSQDVAHYKAIITPDFDTNRNEGLLNLILVIVGILIAEAMMQFLQVYYANWLGQTVTIDLRAKIYSHISRFRLKYFDNTAVGTLVTRVVSDIDGIAQIFSQGLLTIIGDILKLIIVLFVMFYINWELALISLIPIPILIIATRLFKNAIKKAFIAARNQVSRLNAFVQEHVTGMTIVQIFNREKEEMDRFDKINQEHRNAHIKSIWAYAIFFPIVELLSALSIALLLWFGIEGVFTNDVTYGELIQYILYIFLLYRPIRQLADRFNTLQMGIVNADRVFKVLDTEAAIPNTGTITEAEIKGNIEFQNVWFAYNEEEYVLKDLTFDLKAGQTIAFVGATGAGKSSVINLLSRFYEYDKGAIKLEGQDLRDYDINFIRKNIAVVLQDVFLFSDSIYNNITLNDPSITREQVIEAAKIVGAHDFIMKLPGDYDYDVKERGATLSVGQRQLIAFIRAYVYNPRILVLDEATSSVDTESEELIQHAIEKLTENRTSIVIAHRLSTIQRADNIIVLDHGKILEMGTHNELLQQDGQYKHLFELQFS